MPVSQFEAVPESLKNVLLVMNASGFLVPPFVEHRTADQALLWDQTFQRIAPFLPELERELFPRPRQVVPVPFEGVQPRRTVSGHAVQGVDAQVSEHGQGQGYEVGPGGGSPVIHHGHQQEQELP